MKNAIVLGAYGFIGTSIVRSLQDDGFNVRGVGRSRVAAEQTFPDLDWVIRDIPSISTAEWSELFRDVDLVVNASGALQDGVRDDLEAIHVSAVGKMLAALGAEKPKFVQISAANVSKDAPTAFFRTKADRDALVQASNADWVILRPVLVLGRDAYGGTALLRAAAAFPLIQFRMFTNAAVQTMYVDDLAAAVVQVAHGELGSRFTADVGESGKHSFPEMVGTIRSWLGFPQWRVECRMPRWGLTVAGRAADLAGWFGWRSPLRTTALASLAAGVVADTTTWRERGGIEIRSLDATLRAMPATAQERMFSRAYLLLPVCIACLSGFWLLSGLIGLISVDAAKQVLMKAGISESIASTAVIGGSIIDVMLGLAVLWRNWTKIASLAMVAVSLGYLAFGSLLTPGLWLDPLGPFVKIFPALILALTLSVLMSAR